MMSGDWRNTKIIWKEENTGEPPRHKNFVLAFGINNPAQFKNKELRSQYNGRWNLKVDDMTC